MAALDSSLDSKPEDQEEPANVSQTIEQNEDLPLSQTRDTGAICRICDKTFAFFLIALFI